jgi:hypothetical protein
MLKKVALKCYCIVILLRSFFGTHFQDIYSRYLKRRKEGLSKEDTVSWLKWLFAENGVHPDAIDGNRFLLVTTHIHHLSHASERCCFILLGKWGGGVTNRLD